MNQQPTTTWRNPRWASLRGPLSPMRPILESLSEFLARPTFYNGIQIGNGGTPTPGPDGKPIMPPVVDITPDYLDSLTVYDPAAPTGAIGQGGIHTVILEWQGALGGTYQVQLATSSAFTTILHDVTVTGLVTSITGLNPATTYYARVRAVNPKDNTDVGAWSATMTAATGRVGNSDIAANAISANQIQAGQITADHLTAAGITADKIVGGTIDASNISGVSITGVTITGSTVTGGIVQSSSGGDRIVLDSAESDAIKLYKLGAFAPARVTVESFGALKLTNGGSTQSYVRITTGGVDLNGSLSCGAGDVTLLGGSLRGTAGSGGARIRVRDDNNSLSFNWDGTTLRFFIGDTQVKTL